MVAANAGIAALTRQPMHPAQHRSKTATHQPNAANVRHAKTVAHGLSEPIAQTAQTAQMAGAIVAEKVLPSLSKRHPARKSSL